MPSSQCIREGLLKCWKYIRRVLMSALSFLAYGRENLVRSSQIVNAYFLTGTSSIWMLIIWNAGALYQRGYHFDKFWIFGRLDIFVKLFHWSHGLMERNSKIPSFSKLFYWNRYFDIFRNSDFHILNIFSNSL